MQQGCLIAFTEIAEMVCPRLGAGNVLSGGGKLSKKQRLYTGGVTDSCLAYSTPDTGESSVWTCCSMANSEQNNNIIKIREAAYISTFKARFGPEIHDSSIMHLEKEL